MKPRRLQVFRRQEEAPPAALRNKLVVLIDVLRACSTLTTAFHAGAKEAWCFGSVRDVFRARRAFTDCPLLFCGERNRLAVRGFDLGNSPTDFTTARCAGRTLLMTTTNGTRALRRTQGARDVVLGCFLNLSVVTTYLLDRRGDAALLCAGTEGDVSCDDLACAGAMAEKLSAHGIALADASPEAIHVWRAARKSLRKFLTESRGGAPLARAGLERDIAFCTRRDRFNVVPRLVERRNGFRLAPVHPRAG